MPRIDGPITESLVTSPASPPVEVGPCQATFLPDPAIMGIRVQLVPGVNATHSTVALLDPVEFPGTIDQATIIAAINNGAIGQALQPTDPNDPTIPVYQFDFPNLEPGKEYRGVAFSSNVTP